MKICPKCGREYADTNSLCTLDGMALEKAGDALVGQTLADKYRIEERLRDGGMGTVYRGTHVLMEKPVAVKVLHPSLAADDVIVARFSREARAASRISHPHALNVTDFGESNGIVFLVMEYLRGHTLKEVIHNEGPLPLPRVVEIMRQVSGALEAAHAEGIVHRDLKSDNIMLEDAGGGKDWAKVLDFGIAKIQESVGHDPALTAPNLIIGTPQYMSPEQCSQASELDARSDIYSLGVILYEMLAGHVPFTGESPTAIMMKHLQEPPPSILEERPDLPPAAGRVIARAMAKRPEDRYQKVSELIEALVQAAHATPTSAVTASPTSASQSNRATARIVVPTEANAASPQTASTLQDEATVVQPAVPGRSVIVETEPVRPSSSMPPPTIESFKPARIIVPAIAGILVLFAVLYFITSRDSGTQTPVTDSSAPQTTSDPKSRPAQTAPPATGQGETNLNINAPAVNANANVTPNLNQNRATSAVPPPTSSSSSGVNENTNTRRRANLNSGNAPENENAEDESDTPPDSSNSGSRNSGNVRNTNRRELPTPQITPSGGNNDASDNDEPPPLPAPRKKSSPAPLPKPAQPSNSSTLPDAPPLHNESGPLE